MLTAGIDIGSTGAKTVLFEDGKILSYAIIPTGGDSVETSEKVMAEALINGDRELEDVEYIVSTGYGRVLVPFAQRNITEISCHAKGALFEYPSIRTILDIGGQDCKVIRCNDKGKIVNFVLNEKCAAGTGRFLDVIARTLEIPIEEIGERSMDLEDEPPVINSTCVLYAKTEVLKLIRHGVHKNEILAGIFEAQASRIYSLIHKAGFAEDFMITGGVAKNIGMVKKMEEKVHSKAIIAEEPQIIGALGAALFASELCAKANQ